MIRPIALAVLGALWLPLANSAPVEGPVKPTADVPEARGVEQRGGGGWLGASLVHRLAAGRIGADHRAPGTSAHPARRCLGAEPSPVCLPSYPTVKAV
jgi:hypothetical protein